MRKAIGGWIDITRKIAPDMQVFPGDPQPRLETERGSDGAAVTRLALTTHTGTHCDLPPHIDERFETPTEGQILHALRGRAVIIRARGTGSDPSISLESLRRAVRERPPRRLLIRSDPSHRGRGHLTPEAARWLAGRTLLVGTDELSIDPPGTGLAVHRILLGSGTLILENLSLANIAAGSYDLIALPMRLEAPDGAPVRALIQAV